MADLSKIIEQKHESAKYMVEQIDHICKNIPKRAPGDPGERESCEYMAGILKDCGCERVDVESFKENPGSFYGWIYITISCVLLAQILYFFLPALGAALILGGFVIMFLQFGFYFKAIDRLFPEKTGTNVTAIKKCSGEVRGRVFFNGHPDAAWNWPVNEKLGGWAYEGNIVLVVVGALVLLGISIANAAKTGGAPMIMDPAADPLMFYFGIATLAFAPFWIGTYRMWEPNKVVDGANDNLSACLISVAILKALKDHDVDLEHTEVGVILSGSEEAGLRGAKAWCEAHKGEFDDVPTWIYSMDTIHDPKFLGVNYRDLNATVAADKEVCDSFMNAAKELGIHCNKTLVPPFGGATDSAAFAQAGFRATGVTALNHVLEDYYHTVKDTPENLNPECLADCFAICVKCLENFENKVAEK